MPVTRKSCAKTVYCPRCDKPFPSILSRVDAMRMLRDHMKKAHADLLYMLED